MSASVPKKIACCSRCVAVLTHSALFSPLAPQYFCTVLAHCLRFPFALTLSHNFSPYKFLYQTTATTAAHNCLPCLASGKSTNLQFNHPPNTLNCNFPLLFSLSNCFYSSCLPFYCPPCLAWSRLSSHQLSTTILRACTDTTRRGQTRQHKPFN